MNISKKKEKVAIQDSKNDNSLIILPADEGRATVILDRAIYLERCYDHINNGLYKRLSKDPTKSTKQTCLNKLKDLESSLIKTFMTN